MVWWKSNTLRLIQNNIRESDANLNVDLLMGQLNKFSTNVLMMNAGGIVAFYPTKLEYHYRAADQRKDLLQEAIEKAHANGMKFIARFDFSKAHESIFKQQPEWFYRTREGHEVNYFGIVHTCINGYYQREYSLQLIDEVISNYDVDGIFFNMFGYQTRDYSGHHYGICFCENCKASFRERYHLDLPETESLDDPVYRKYKEFQYITTKEMLDRIHELVKNKNENIAISTYNEHKVDIVRKESNTAIDRPHPVWLYSASENVKSLEDSWDEKLISNCNINAIDLIHRFTAVSKHEINIRLKESIASGSGLDFCIIGVFEDYPDRENFSTVEGIFKYHQENERYYGHFSSVFDVALIKPGGPVQKNLKEYLGLFKMLKEQHVQFDVIHQNNLANKMESLQSYKVVIVPNVAEFSEDELKGLESLYRQGVRLISTGLSFTQGMSNQTFLEQVFGVKLNHLNFYSREAAYLQTEDKSLFKRFQERDWIIMDGPFYQVDFDSQTQKQLPFVNPSTFGPPERAFGHELSAYCGSGIREVEDRMSIYIPWMAGELYYKYGYADHKHIVLDLLDHAVEQRYKLTTNAPQNVEVFFNRLDDHTYILHLLNLSGFNGVTYFEPNTIFDINITLHDIGRCSEIMNLVDQEKLEFSVVDQDTTLKIVKLADFAAIVIKA